MAYPDEVRDIVIGMLADGIPASVIAQTPIKGYLIPRTTINEWPLRQKRKEAQACEFQGIIAKHLGQKKAEAPIAVTEATKHTLPAMYGQKILLYDLEVLPNRGFFFDRFADRGIPLDFIETGKAICTIAYKWRGSEETHVITADPYDDKKAITEFAEIRNQADFVCGHFIDGFDEPFLHGRVLANGLPPLKPLPTIDTYKLAKKHFRNTLNSNKLDHLGELLGVGRKNRTDATLWVRCANGDKDALDEMAAYNAQDVMLLEAVLDKLLPHVKTKLNANIAMDGPTARCNSCGSEALEPAGFVFTSATKKEVKRCTDCGSYSQFKVTCG